MKTVGAILELVFSGLCLVLCGASADPTAISHPAACPNENGYVMTKQGCVQGDIVDGVSVFKGIPFAAPPIGNLRWKEPVTLAVRSTILETRKFSARCMQPVVPLQRSPSPLSEDCLYLNIWTPAKFRTKMALPVMVYVHGGGNTTGSASETPGQGNLFLYDGQQLAKRGHVIVVTIQYRLNVFGYLVHPALDAESGHKTSGDYGLLDQIAAFHWVKNNIEFFGGDPSHVLLFGESGGGADVCALVASPLAKGLFSSAIMESGGCEARSKAEMQAWSAGLITSADCAGAADPIACLRGKNAADLIKRFGLTATQPGGKIVVMSGPTVDGYVLPQSPVDALRTGQFNHVPFVMGVNAQETSSPLFRIPDSVTESEYATFVRAQLPGEADKVLEHYPAKNYVSPRFALVAITTDYQFICPTRRYLEFAAPAQKEPVYGYLYAHIMEGGPVRLSGAMHGLELYFVFQTMDLLRPYAPSESDRRLEKIVLGYWTQFAATGDPNGGGLANWAPFNLSAKNYLDLSATPKAAAPLGAEQCDFWNSLAPPGRVH